MLWSVEKSVRLRDEDRYALILISLPLKMIAEVLTSKQIFSSDIIYPTENALYLINNNENHTLKVIYAMKYSANKWGALIKANT